MKILFHTFILITLTLNFFLVSTYADEFGEGDLKFHISFVPIASNAPSTNYFGKDMPYTDYDYRIGKTEISIAQFLQARAADSRISRANMDFWNSGRTNFDTEGNNPLFGVHAPVSNINIIECFKYCNWLTSGDPYKGVYKIIKNTNPENDSLNPDDYIDISSAVSEYGTVYKVPSFSEWSKAAYFKPDHSGFSFYSNGSGSGNIYSFQNTNTEAGIQLFTETFGEHPKEIIMMGSIEGFESEIRYLDTNGKVQIITPNKGVGGWNSDFQSYPWQVGSSPREQNGTYDMFGNIGEYFEEIVSFLNGTDFKIQSSCWNWYNNLGGNDLSSLHTLEVFTRTYIGADLSFYREGLEFGLSNVGLRIASIGIIPPESPMPEVRSTITDGAAHLNWDSTVGRIYQLQYTNSLENPNWVDIGQKIHGSGGTEFFVVPVDTIEEKNRFYRVIDAD